MPRLNEIEHTADRAFRVQGRTLAALFASAAEALFRMQSQRARKNDAKIREVEVRGLDRETLLVNWLNEVLYLQEAHGEMYTSAEILEISDEHLKAKLIGRSDGAGRRVIKAVTFHGLRIKETSRGLEADIVVDV